MQAENMSVFDFEDGLVRKSPGVAEIEFLGDGIAVAGIDDTAHAACGECRLGSGEAGLTIGNRRGAIGPLSKCPGTRHGIGGVREAEHGLKNGGVGMLLHEQRNVLEGVAEVQTESATDYMFSSTG